MSKLKSLQRIHPANLALMMGIDINQISNKWLWRKSCPFCLKNMSREEGKAGERSSSGIQEHWA